MSGGKAARWQGTYVEVLEDGTWRFIRCLRCDRLLSAPNDGGYGPECRRRRPLDWETERRKALAKDRAVYRADRRAGVPI